MNPPKKKQYTLWINELRLKQSISTSFSNFYNPVALIILVYIAKSSNNKEFIVVPNKSHSISKYITFIEKNNERVLKKIHIDYIFNELLTNSFDNFFFLVEMDNEAAAIETLQVLETFLNTHLALEIITPKLVIKSIQDFFENLSLSNFFLWNKSMPVSSDDLEVHITTDLLSLDATLKIHF